MVECVLEYRWTIEATAERFQVDAKTVRKWRDRFLAEGPEGLQDRSSRPHRCPNRTPEPVRSRVLELRRCHRWGAERIAFRVGLAASTVPKPFSPGPGWGAWIGATGPPAINRSSVISGNGPAS